LSKKKKKGQFKKTWSYVFPHFLRYKGRMLFVMLLILLASIADPIMALLSEYFVKYYVMYPDLGRSTLWVVPISIILIFTYRGVFNFSSKYFLERLCLRVVRNINVALYEHFLFLSLDHYEQTTTGKMMARTTADVNQMQKVVPLTIDVFHNIIQLTGLVAVCIYKDPYLSALAVLAIPVTVYPVERISKAMKRYTKKGLGQIAEINSTMQETYSGAKVVKAFAMEEKEVARYDGETRVLLKIQFKYAAVKHMISPLIGIISSISIGFVVYLAVRKISEKYSQDPEILKQFMTEFSSFVVAIVLMYNPVRKLGTIAGHFNSAYGAAERIQETFEKQSTVTEDPDAVELPKMKDKIVYKGINFKYDQENILEDFNLEIKKGEVVALVGESGSGKSTIVNILPRFYKFQKGNITIDGMDITKATLKSLRMQIGVVTQETFLFDMSVADNISYGSESKNMDDIINSAKTANAHDFIIDLPGGYDTVIGERGVRLSGGQKQRIAIARAIMKDPPILILDEATSALDTSSEREVQNALEELMKSRTTIAIAHRLSTIRHADKIVVIQKGKVVEIGTHTQLMNQNGEYKRLYEMQFFLGKHSIDHYSNDENNNEREH
jgi:ATP-binding cassette, subfamily B, bacterial MsbA